MIDIHCHILPAFDDGAADIEEALEMARTAAESGVKTIVATPHFRGEKETFSSLNKLVSRYQKLVHAVEQDGLALKVIPGAEILCLPQTPELARQKQLPTLGDTDYLLAEFFFNESRDFMEHVLRSFTESGYKVVVAHPERYHAVQRDPMTLVKWFQDGYVLQLNKGSILGDLGPKPERTAHWALERGVAHIVASDGHSPRRRNTEMQVLRQYLRELCPEEYVETLLQRNPDRLIHNQPMVPLDAL